MKKLNIRLLILLPLVVIIVGFFSTPFSYAQDSTNLDVQEKINALRKQLIQLESQLKEARDKIREAKKEVAAPSESFRFTRTLLKKSTGNDVSKLQQLLAEDSEVYPEGLVTGYFGSLTEAAVQRFQTNKNIVHFGDPETTGYGQVGLLTRTALNKEITTRSFVFTETATDAKAYSSFSTAPRYQYLPQSQTNSPPVTAEGGVTIAVVNNFLNKSCDNVDCRASNEYIFGDVSIFDESWHSIRFNYTNGSFINFDNLAPNAYNVSVRAQHYFFVRFKLTILPGISGGYVEIMPEPLTDSAIRVPKRW